MKSIIYVGMDVHKSSFTLCSMKAQFGLDDVFFAHARINPEAREVKKYLDRLQENLNMKQVKIMYLNAVMRLAAWVMRSIMI